MTIFDTETDRYLEKLGESPTQGDWRDVERRARRARRRARRMHVGVGGGLAAAATTAAVLMLSPVDHVGGRSVLDKAEAAVLAPVQAAPGTIEHILVEYRTDGGRVFNEYETWVAADGAWCRRTVEGLPQEPQPDTRLTECRSPEGVQELYLPSRDEILRTRPGARTPAETGDVGVKLPAEPGGRPMTVRVSPDGKLVVRRNGKALTIQEVADLPARQQKAIKAAIARGAPPAGGSSAEPDSPPDWLTENVVEAFRREAVREAGTMTLDGREYTKLVTRDGRNTVLVDPDTGEGVAWIPSPEAFGVPTTVVRTRRTLPADDRSLSLTALHPDAAVREVTPAELERAKAAQYPRG